MTDLASLLAALAAGPGSRELSDEVLLALGWARHDKKVHHIPKIWWESPTGYTGKRPSPTESVDDALAMIDVTLDPDWHLRSRGGRRLDILYQAQKRMQLEEAGADNWISRIARYICIAIIEAREAKDAADG